MRSDRRKKVQELKNNKFNKATHRWSIVFLLITIAFTVMMVSSGLLIAKLLLIIGGVIALLTLMIFPALYSWRFKRSRKIICLVLSVIMSFVYGVGIFYFAGTLDFFSKITEIASSIEEYYVVVRDDGSYEKYKDIKGETVYAYDSGEGLEQAIDIVKDDTDAEVKKKSDLEGLIEDLFTGEKDILLMNSANHIAVCDSHESFGDFTKILKKVKVKCSAKDISKRVNVTKESFNVYITGLDTDGDISTTSRSDVNMIATVNPKTKTVLLTSIPRDYYVEVSGSDGQSDKLTHTGLYGAGTTVETVENMMGIDMNYYVKVNYATVKALIDAIDGITVNSDYSFTTHGMDVSMDFVEGENYLDGEAALAFARERYSFPDGDFQRNKNQQAVLKGALKKVTTSSTLLTKYTSILNSVEDYLEMNFSPKEIKSLVKMQMRDMKGWSVKTQSITGNISDEYMPCYALNGGYASVVMQDEDSISKAKEKITKVMEER